MPRSQYDNNREHYRDHATQPLISFRVSDVFTTELYYVVHDGEFYGILNPLIRKNAKTEGSAQQNRPSRSNPKPFHCDKLHHYFGYNGTSALYDLIGGITTSHTAKGRDHVARHNQPGFAPGDHHPASV